MHEFLLVGATFLACLVEMVEALTIVLAVGATRGWRSAMYGTCAAATLLAAFVVALGPRLAALPIGSLRLAIGGLLLVFGLGWLRKAILRAGRLKHLHDEQSIFEEQEREARGVGPSSSAVDWYSFTVAFKGVLLEGLEVAFIVVTFGGAQHSVALASAAAAAAAVVVLIAGLVARRPLVRVPENSLKFVVGIMLVTFGIFWSSEGAGIKWPGGDLALVPLLAFMAGASLLMVHQLRRPRRLELPRQALA
jgi:uncharacterized membrane protein